MSSTSCSNALARYAKLRRHTLWQPLFQEGQQNDMHAFMTQSNQFKLCHFVGAVLRRRQQLLDHLRENPRLDFYDSSDEDDTDD